MSTRSPRRAWRTPSGAGRPLTWIRCRPARERMRRRITSVAPRSRRSCSCRSCATGLASLREKTPETSASSAPDRIRSAEARPPTRRSTASTRMDFPAPVSPVKTVKPSANSNSIASMMAKLRMRSSVSTQVSDGGREELVDRLFQYPLRHGPDDLFNRLAALEKEQGGNAHDTVFAGDVRILVRVELQYFQFAVVFLRQLLDDGRHHLARPAPPGPEVPQHQAIGLAPSLSHVVELTCNA